MAELVYVESVDGTSRGGDAAEATPSDAEALDAYSRVITSVAERLTPSVANLRVSRRVRGGRVLEAEGAAS
jgi:hypothetical protein